MNPREIARHPFAWVFAGAVAIYFVVVLTAPELWLRLAAKEGPFEHAGHAVLAGALVCWVSVAARTAGRARTVALCVAVYLMLALLEEIDWGHVYGLDLGHSLVARWTGGSPNLHNAQSSHASMAGWSVVWMSAPMLVFFGLPLAPLRRIRDAWARCAPACSRAPEGLLFYTAAVLTVVIDGWPLLSRQLGYVPRAGAGDPIGAPLGFFQITFYVAWALVAVRALCELAAGPSASARAGVG